MVLHWFSVPMQMSILLKEHFNRWYSLKAFYTAITLLDLPISTFCCFVFTLIVYFTTSQPMEVTRFLMFFAISLLVSFIAQGTGLMIGAIFNVVVSKSLSHWSKNLFIPVIIIIIIVEIFRMEHSLDLLCPSHWWCLLVLAFPCAIYQVILNGVHMSVSCVTVWKGNYFSPIIRM